jgi:hypothetical protein
MKINMPACFTFILCFMLSVAVHAQSSKTIHQTFQLDGVSKVNINVVGSKIEMRETKGSRVMVEMTIKLSVPNDRLLDFVINNGRYDLLKETDNTSGELVISSKRGNNVLIVQGKECFEEVSYVFYLPPAIKYANNSTIENINRD